MTEIVQVNEQFTITIISVQAETWEFIIEAKKPGKSVQHFVAGDTEELKSKIGIICEDMG